MELRQLEYIVAIADQGNITKAAESLFITRRKHGRADDWHRFREDCKCSPSYNV